MHTPTPAVVNMMEAKQKALVQPLPDVFAWGRGRAVPAIREDLMGIAVTYVACGAAHCGVVSDDGRLYTWGENAYGQLGHGDKSVQSRRRPVVSLTTLVRTVACGRAHTAVCTRDGDLWCCGSHELGQLGVGVPLLGEADGGEGGNVLDAMRCAPFFAAVTPAHGGRFCDVSCGEAHTLALDTDGAVFGWGAAEVGQLGFEADEEAQYSPRRVAGLPHASRFCCGDEFSLVLDAEGQIWGFGANFTGQLGLDAETDVCFVPTCLTRHVGISCGVAQVACGADHAAAVDCTGALWVWGGRFGEAGPVSLPQPAAANGLEDVEEADTMCTDATACELVACGAGLVLACTYYGSCYVWGEGSNGRLGLGDNEQDHASPQLLATLSADGTSRAASRLRAAAIGKGVGSMDAGPGVLALAAPANDDAFEAQFERLYLGAEWESTDRSVG